MGAGRENGKRWLPPSHLFQGSQLGSETGWCTAQAVQRGCTQSPYGWGETGLVLPPGAKLC